MLKGMRKRMLSAGALLALLTAAGEASAMSPVVPVRDVFEAMGAKVTWSAGSNLIEITKDELTLRLQTGSSQAYKNGTPVTLDTPVTVNASGKAMISAYAVYPLAKNYKKERHYLVQKGDSLWSVSRKYGVTVAQLKEWNALKTDTIYIGQHLTTVNPWYVVQKGDSLYSISSKTETTIADLRKANGLQSDALQVGQKLSIPAAPSVPSPGMFVEGTFPLLGRTYLPFGDTYGDARMFSLGQTARVHEGNDMEANTGVPVFASWDGLVIRKGWNTYGGWRLTIQADNGIAMYYAHLSAYAGGIELGSRIKKEQLIGYVGATGYGPAGTSGKFIPHLHFGMYDTNASWKPLNPYAYLKWWETR
ncbi:LysM peptidoglycan-binding domain-containing protein [Paenibacillus caseinilyticus]|uniref:LysM peptidoglycan-binding domain-containing protein n=1 Tax=Paenibacillus caseinilyticus TaxID=3098138 RepID=UPI0022B920B6|nr:LysM peptidoglycan-binding domain-containing protein [Paenibacillus caseinilyticus]MCZ8521594.1 LysM peptidoglycan-binding domain-containing protein [Paenibacillus caseinilyticus]